MAKLPPQWDVYRINAHYADYSALQAQDVGVDDVGVADNGFVAHVESPREAYSTSRMMFHPDLTIALFTSPKDAITLDSLPSSVTTMKPLLYRSE